MSSIRVLVNLQKIEGDDGGGDAVLTYQHARATTPQVGATSVPDIENCYETEKLRYMTHDEAKISWRAR